MLGGAIVMAMAATAVLGAPAANGTVRPLPRFDRDGDFRADLVVVREDPYGNTEYHWLKSAIGYEPLAWGHANAIPVPAAYSGTAMIEAGEWVPGYPGEFRSKRHVGFGDTVVPWGQLGDDPTVTADYDGDFKADPSVYRPGSPSVWFIHGSRGADIVVPWGEAGDVPVPGDYDGDAVADVAIARVGANGSFYFYIRGSSMGFRVVNFGDGEDLIIPGDFDGDGRTDITVTRDVGGVMTWYILRSSGGMSSYQFGNTATDYEVAADYDGDTRTDIAVWREESPGRFFILNSSNGSLRTEAWGEPGDYPLANIYVR